MYAASQRSNFLHFLSVSQSLSFRTLSLGLEFLVRKILDQAVEEKRERLLRFTGQRKGRFTSQSQTEIYLLHCCQIYTVALGRGTDRGWRNLQYKWNSIQPVKNTYYNSLPLNVTHILYKNLVSDKSSLRICIKKLRSINKYRKHNHKFLLMPETQNTINKIKITTPQRLSCHEVILLASLYTKS